MAGDDMAETATERKHTKGTSSGSKWDHTAKIAVAMGALFGMVTAAIPLVLLVINPQAQARDEAQTEVQDLSGTVQSQRDTITELESQVVAQEEEINRLRTQETTPGPSPTSDGPAIRHEDPLDINPTSSHADLDAPQSDPQWGRTTSGGSGREGPRIFPASQLTWNYGSYVIMEGTGADFESCLRATDYRDDALEIARLSVGSELCILTSEERFGLMTVRRAEPESVGFDVIIWEND
jgi:cell division protein FtsL